MLCFLRQKLSYKGGESLSTKPYELLMTHEKNEVSIPSQIFKMVAYSGFSEKQCYSGTLISYYLQWISLLFQSYSRFNH